MWGVVAGSGCTAGASAGAPVWYAHYDGNPSFSDWVPFGGWSHPAVKQYSGTGSLCGIGIDSSKIGALGSSMKNVVLSKARTYARNNGGLVLGGLAALAIGAGLMRGRR